MEDPTGAGFDLAVVFEALGTGLVIEPFLPSVLAGSAIAHAGGAAWHKMLASLIEGSRAAEVVLDAARLCRTAPCWARPARAWQCWSTRSAAVCWRSAPRR